MNLAESIILNIYKENNKDHYELSNDIFSFYLDDSLIRPYIEYDLSQMALDNLLDFDVELICYELHKFIWNIKYQVNNIKINNYKIYSCYFIEPDTMIFEYRKIKQSCV